MMKYLCFLVGVLLLSETKAMAITITDVKVSVTADSAGAAREQALVTAHGLAFQKLLKEHFPESSSSSPPQETLENMVTTFSIDKEKTSPQGYAASLTFQFDEPQVQAWLQRDPSSTGLATSSLPLPQKERETLKVIVSYDTYPEWQHVKKSLETAQEVEKVTILSLSSKNADLELTHRGDIAHLQDQLRQRHLLLTSREDVWELASSKPQNSK